MKTVAALVASLSLSLSVHAYDNGAQGARLPSLGWSSWVGLAPPETPGSPQFDFCSEDTVKAAADAMEALSLFSDGPGSSSGPQLHLRLDDCWAGPRTTDGTLTADPSRFPNGMKVVADYVHSKTVNGKPLLFGVYTCMGSQTCVGGRPGSLGHYDQDAKYFAAQGIDAVKADWCHTTGLDPKVQYPILSKALNETGRPILFNSCEWGVENPWEWADEWMQSWRATGDHTATWPSTKSIIQQSANIPANYTGRPYGYNDLDMIESGNYGQVAHANGKTPNMTADEYKTEFSMWAISASPLIVTTKITNCTMDVPPAPGGVCNVTLKDQHSQDQCTAGSSFGCYANGSMWTDNGCRGEFTCNGYDTVCDVDGEGRHVCGCGGQLKCFPWITDLQKEILYNTEVIAVNQDVTPQGRPVNGPQDLTVWSRKLSDGSIAVALYNQEDDPVAITVNFEDIGWSASTSATVRDLWLHQDMGTHTGQYGRSSVLGHQTVMLRLVKTSE